MLVSPAVAHPRAGKDHPTTMADDAEFITTWGQLRGLVAAGEEGILRYAAGVPARGLHVVEVATEGRRFHRTLLRGEAYWWALGLADGWGRGDLIAAAAAEYLPELLDITDAAARLRLSVAAVRNKISAGGLYPIYGAWRLRLFAAQVMAQVDPGGDRVRVWQGLRQRLPPPIRPDQLAEDVTPVPSPQPWPIAPGRRPRRCRDALMIGDGRGWFRFLHPAPDGGGFAVEVANEVAGTCVRQLPDAGVLPWVLGVADRRGLGDVVAYRAGLG